MKDTVIDIVKELGHNLRNQLAIGYQKHLHTDIQNYYHWF